MNYALLLERREPSLTRADTLKDEKIFFVGKNLSFGAVRCKLTSPNRVENLQGKASTYPCIGEGQHGKAISGKRNGRLAEPRWLQKGVWVGGFGSPFWKEELERIFEGWTSCAKEFEIYYLRNKEVM